MRTLVFDTETTNLMGNIALPDHKKPHIMEFFGLYLTGNIDVAHGWLINPTVLISEDAERITGINAGMLRNAPIFGAVADDIVKLIESSDRVVAHNLSFDMDMIDTELRRIDRKVNWPKDKVCTVEATEHFTGKRLNLGDLHKYLFGEPFEGAHRAEVDVRALTRCYRELLERGEI